jgi:carbamoyl-phosphate synthase large subunit
MDDLYDKIYRVPHAEDDDYQETIINICRNENADLAVAIPELEVLFWTRHSMPVRCLTPPPRFSQIAISKASLYQHLKQTSLIPKYETRERAELLHDSQPTTMQWPLWIRDFKAGSSSARGALLVENPNELTAWIVLNANTDEFMLSEYLPGRNFACQLLYYHGELEKIGTYERLDYFMANNVLSGVSGNISRGRLTRNEKVSRAAQEAVSRICSQTGEVMHGIVTVDLKEDVQGAAKITEINLRHVACTSAFASAGNNFAEAHVFATLERSDMFGAFEPTYPPENLILRDIDGPPQWVPRLAVPAEGQALKRHA